MELKLISKTDDEFKNRMAELLVEGFGENWPNAWPTVEDGMEEVEECLGEDRITLVLLDEEQRVVGWIGAISQYDGHVWELHPLVVDQKLRHKGFGRMLVEGLEEQVRLRGGITIQLGSDDENGMTSLADVDLYEDLWKKVREIKNIKGHPYEFYQKCGYKIIGVMPDANGWGKPDIYMGKRVSGKTE